MRSLHRHLRWRGITTSQILIIILQYAYLTSAIPTITFPINSQVPPVARPNTPFNFTFSPSTFSSNLPLTYTLISGPSWLSLDLTTRTLSGTPPESDAGTAPMLEIEARDDTGAVTLTSTLVVRADLPPEVAVPLRDQIEGFGADVSAPDALLFYPSTAFRFQFSADTFKDTGGNGLTLYAVTLENTPLPSWITFDAGTMTFNGETPDSGSLVAPPELFGIQLIASDVLGFAGASVPFYFVVQNHMLVWEEAFVEVNATIGEALSYSGLNGKLMLDGNVVGNGGGVKVTSNAPDWLALGEDFSLTGTVPEGTTDFDVQVEATDEFNDMASVVVSFSISSGLFVEEDIAPLNATIGDKFEYDVRQAFINPDEVSIAVSIEPETPWLSYSPTTMILSGEVPDDADITSISVTITGSTDTALSKRATESKTITINVVPSSGSTSPSSSVTDPTPTSTPSTPSGTGSSESEAATSDTRKGLSASEIAIAVVVPNVVLILALLAIFCCWRRKKHERLLDKFTIVPKGSKGRRNISPPIAHDGPNILSESSTTLSDHPGLRSHPVHPAYRRERDAEDTDVESEASFYPRRSVPRRSATFSRVSQYLSSFADSELASQHENHGLRRSVSANYVVHGEKSWPTTKDRASMPNAEGSRLSRDFSINGIGVAKTDKRKTVERNSGWKYKPYRTFSERSVLSSDGSVQITPERQYMPPRTSWYGLPNREASRKGKTRNYIGSIAGISMKPDETKNSGIGHGRNVSSISNFSIPHQHPTMRPFESQPGHGQWQSVDSDRTWQTVPSSPKKQFNAPMRPPSAMSALTENTDLLFSDILPPALSSARDSPSSNYDTNTPVANSFQTGGSRYANPATIRVVSKSSMQRPSSRGSNKTQISSTSAPSVARPVTRRGPGESPFFAGSSSRATSRAARQRSTKTLNYFAGYDSPTIQERDETNESLERSILEDLHVSPNTLNSMPNDLPRDSLGINYGDSSPIVNRKSRVYIPAAAFRSPSEATRQLGTFESDVAARPSWNQGGAFAQNRQSVLSHASDASSRYNEASSSPGIFFHRTSNSEDKENEDSYDTYFTKPIYPSRESQQVGGRASPYSAHSGPTPTNPSRATFRDSNLTSTSLHYGEDESPEIGNAAFIQRPHSTFLRPGSRSHLNSVYPTQLSPGIDPSWRLTPVSPRPVDLGKGRLVSGPGRDVKGGLRNSHGREGSLSVGHFVVSEDKDAKADVLGEEEWMRRTEEERRQAEREGTPGVAFL